jgi:SAM-dependent methyltransferase
MEASMRNKNTTIEYYDNNAISFVNSSIDADMHPMADLFLQYLPDQAKILDLGCGTGRDSLYFLQHGYESIPTDGSAEMCKIAAKLTGIPVRQLMFEDLAYDNEFDGVWACASLLHLGRQSIPCILKKVSSALKENGIAYLSFKYGNFEGTRNGRFFTDLSERDITFLCSKDTGLMLERYLITPDVRPGRDSEKWLNIFARKYSEDE